MWKLFKKRFKIRLSDDIQEWIQETILWQINSIPDYDLKKFQVQLPQTFFSDMKSSSFLEGDLEPLLEKLIAMLNLPRTKLKLELFTTHIDTVGSVILEQETDSYAVSFTEKIGNRYLIGINRDLLKDKSSITLCLMLELITIKLALLGLENEEALSKEVLVIGYGFGIFSLEQHFNFFQDDSKWGYSKIGELSINEIIYSMSVLSYLKNELNPIWLEYFDSNYKNEMLNTINYLIKNDSLVLNKELIKIKDSFKYG